MRVFARWPRPAESPWSGRRPYSTPYPHKGTYSLRGSPAASVSAAHSRGVGRSSPLIPSPPLEPAGGAGVGFHWHRGVGVRPANAPPFSGPTREKFGAFVPTPSGGLERPSGPGTGGEWPQMSKAGRQPGRAGDPAPRGSASAAPSPALLPGGIIEPRGGAQRWLRRLGRNVETRCPRAAHQPGSRAPRLCPLRRASRPPPASWSALRPRAGSRCRCCCSPASRCWRPQVGTRGAGREGGDARGPRPLLQCLPNRPAPHSWKFRSCG